MLFSLETVHTNPKTSLQTNLRFRLFQPCCQARPDETNWWHQDYGFWYSVQKFPRESFSFSFSRLANKLGLRRWTLTCSSRQLRVFFLVIWCVIVSCCLLCLWPVDRWTPIWEVEVLLFLFDFLLLFYYYWICLRGRGIFDVMLCWLPGKHSVSVIFLLSRE